ncbi:MAG: class I SAM-dependent methyltransferase [Candidatus Coatesbacteria bacterium]|nr:class I SAM-dependent methyltransferase [Candidatus Coatesbacteria bacterium]
MKYIEVGKMWDENAEVWTFLARKGYDIFRNLVNSPAFFNILPDIKGKRGLDLGCGEGYNTKLAAGKGAKIYAIDISKTFIKLASEENRNTDTGIDYLIASGNFLPFKDDFFDFIIATMSIMNMPDQEIVIAECFRVLKPEGFLQFSISHPCFQTPLYSWVYDNEGNKIGVVCGNYFDQPEVRIEEWTFGAAPENLRKSLRKFRIPVFKRTLSAWLNMIIESGFILEYFCEPHADDETSVKYPEVADSRIITNSIIIRCRKPWRI